jgi:hypothetical protein
MPPPQFHGLKRSRSPSAGGTWSPRRIDPTPLKWPITGASATSKVAVPARAASAICSSRGPIWGPLPTGTMPNRRTPSGSR